MSAALDLPTKCLHQFIALEAFPIMSPQTFDLITALQEALERSGVMKEPDQAVKPDRAEVLQGGKSAPDKGGEIVGGTSSPSRTFGWASSDERGHDQDNPADDLHDAANARHAVQASSNTPDADTE